MASLRHPSFYCTLAVSPFLLLGACQSSDSMSSNDLMAEPPPEVQADLDNNKSIDLEYFFQFKNCLNGTTLCQTHEFQRTQGVVITPDELLYVDDNGKVIERYKKGQTSKGKTLLYTYTWDGKTLRFIASNPPGESPYQAITSYVISGETCKIKEEIRGSLTSDSTQTVLSTDTIHCKVSKGNIWG
jgi:hypothetical protein